MNYFKANFFIAISKHVICMPVLFIYLLSHLKKTFVQKDLYVKKIKSLTYAMFSYPLIC